ncbi:hypothetical protein [Microterricola viridarii]|uniref:Uncharacterized protein n=1 Tax=Microterricola viridarii TaxID=412690 RepID=A0A1H1YKV3_9MICO|nr:hypothetical protein [Microterricola viridarii]SDT22080.1 hypothetical protein SAMN04489834_3123 [Microterricola viridarii]
MIGRDAESKLGTARILLAMFDAQIASHDEHMKSTEAMKQRSIKAKKFDPTIIERIDGLREGRETGAARVNELEAQAGEQP